MNNNNNSNYNVQTSSSLSLFRPDASGAPLMYACPTRRARAGEIIRHPFWKEKASEGAEPALVRVPFFSLAPGTKYSLVNYLRREWETRTQGIIAERRELN